jgi:hypothetical protein
VWKTQPDGGESGLGNSPSISRGARNLSAAGSGIGAASSKSLV